MSDYNLKTPDRPNGLLGAVEKLMYWAQISLPAVYGEELTYAKEQGKMAEKINEIVEQLNVNTEWTQYLLNEGVESETVAYINELIGNGTLPSLINNELLGDMITSLNNRMDDYQSYVNSKLNAITSGAPQGVADSIANVPANADKTRPYLISGGDLAGHWVYWNGNAWVDGGIYQSMVIGENDVTWGKIKDSSVSYDKIGYPAKTSIEDVPIYKSGYYINAQGEEIAASSFNIRAITKPYLFGLHVIFGKGNNFGVSVKNELGKQVYNTQYKDEFIYVKPNNTAYFNEQINGQSGALEVEIMVFDEKSVTTNSGEKNRLINYFEEIGFYNAGIRTPREAGTSIIANLPFESNKKYRIIDPCPPSISWVYGSFFNGDIYLGLITLDSNNYISPPANTTNIYINARIDCASQIMIENDDGLSIKGSDSVVTSVNKNLQISNLCFYGDSITYGVASIPGSGALENIENSWAKLLCDKLNIPLVNKAKSGACLSTWGTTVNGIESIVRTVVNDTDVYDWVIIAGGTNDWGLSSPYGTYDSTNQNYLMGAINIINSTLKSRGSKVIWVSPIGRTRGSNTPTPYTLTDLRNYIGQKAMINNAYYINGLDLNIPEKTGPYQEAILPDGTHPSRVGHEIMADCVYNLIK